MKAIPSKATKLLALALDTAAHDGEWKNAAVMFIGSLRKLGAKPDALIPAQPATSWTRWESPPPRRDYTPGVKMPFGKFKGKLIREINSDYLEWLHTLKDLKPRLKAAIADELERRSENE